MRHSIRKILAFQERRGPTGQPREAFRIWPKLLIQFKTDLHVVGLRREGLSPKQHEYPGCHATPLTVLGCHFRNLLSELALDTGCQHNVGCTCLPLVFFSRVIPAALVASPVGIDDSLAEQFVE